MASPNDSDLQSRIASAMASGNYSALKSIIASRIPGGNNSALRSIIASTMGHGDPFHHFDHTEYEPDHAAVDFHGWDLMPSTFVTAYMVMAAGLICAVIIYKDFGSKATELKSLPTQAIFFGLFTGVAFGFGGAAHQTLATYFANGHGMSQLWFHPHSQWLALWATSMLFYPLSSASLAGIAMTIAGVGETWIRWLKVTAVAMGIAEVFGSFKHVSKIGKIALPWAIIMSALAIFVQYRKSFKDTGSRYITLAATCNLVGLGLLVITPKACWDTDRLYDDRQQQDVGQCIFPFDFNHRAVFNVLSLFTVALAYFATMVKLRERAPPPPPPPPPPPRRCC